jgi:outer membrane protein assembly factor BamA
MGHGYWDEWEGKQVSNLSIIGCKKTNYAKAVALSGIKPGSTMTRATESQAFEAMIDEGSFEDVDINIDSDPANHGKVIVTIVIKEE